MPLAILRCGPELLREGELSRVGIHLRLRRILPQPIRLRAHDAPGPAIVIEGTRRQREELLLLGVVQHPVEILIVAEEREQLGRVHGWAGRRVRRLGLPRDRPEPAALSPAPRSCRGWSGRARGRAPPRPTPRDSGGGRPASVTVRRAVLAERGSSAAARVRCWSAASQRPSALLGQRRANEQVDVGRCQFEPRLVGRERLAIVDWHIPVVLTQRQLPFGPVRAERLRPVRRLPGLRGQLGRRRAVEIQDRVRAGELGPGRDEPGVQGDRLLVEADGPAQARGIRRRPCACEAASPLR